MSEKPSDEIIAKEWRLAARCYRGGSNLGKRIALRIADDLEASGVTENDIDRIFSPSEPHQEHRKANDA